MLALLGESTFDVLLNDVTFWKNILFTAVWNFTLGGVTGGPRRQRLSYRESKILGRPLTKDECEFDADRRPAASRP